MRPPKFRLARRVGPLAFRDSGSGMRESVIEGMVKEPGGVPPDQFALQRQWDIQVSTFDLASLHR